jgi:hypothetical protein
VLIITEIVEHKRILDFSTGIDNFYIMQSFNDTNWQVYYDYFNPILNDYLQNLTQLCNTK